MTDTKPVGEEPPKKTDEKKISSGKLKRKLSKKYPERLIHANE